MKGCPKTVPSRRRHVGAMGAVFSVGLLGCQEPKIEFDGQPGVPIALAQADGTAEEDYVPLLAYSNEGCPGNAGGCDAFCIDDPATCLAANPDACMPAILASANPLTVLPSAGNKVRTGRECFEIRAAEGLSTPGQADPFAVARFRFEDPPILRAPAQAPDGWSWMSGTDRNAARGVGAILGGNLLNDFAVEIRYEPADPSTTDPVTPTVTFSREFPGSQRALADQGRAYLRLQYPNRLTGVQVSDQCEFDGEDCQLPEIDIAEGRFRVIHERFRMTLDACVAPMPCEVVYEPAPDDPDGDPVCALKRGPNNPLGCSLDEPPLGGRGASLVVATEIPGLALIDDSAATMFGPLDDLPDCTDLGDVPTDVLACIDGPPTGELAMPGWAPLTDLRVLKVRGVALVSGSTLPSSPGPNDASQAPCARLRARLRGAKLQCQNLADDGEPRSPTADRLDRRGPDGRIDVGVFQAGEVSQPGNDDSTLPDPDMSKWIRTLVLPGNAPFVLHTRRDAAGESAQADGFIGGALLRNSEIVLDYTENDAKPGVRATCLDPGGGECASVPVCAGGKHGVRSRSCCYGLPQQLIIQTIQSGERKPQPRVEDECCRALNPEALRRIQEIPAEAGDGTTGGDEGASEFCANVDPL